MTIFHPLLCIQEGETNREKLNIYNPGKLWLLVVTQIINKITNIYIYLDIKNTSGAAGAAGLKPSFIYCIFRAYEYCPESCQICTKTSVL